MLYVPLADLPEAEGGEIVLTSGSPHPMDVTPTFYLADGSSIAGEAVQVQPAETKFLDIKKLLPPASKGRRDWGGLALGYYGLAREISAQLSLAGINGGGSVDEFFVVAGEARSDVQQAVWWMPQGGTAIIALGSVSDQDTSATVQFDDGRTETVNLAPHATAVSRHQRGSSAGAESVSITITGAAGSMVAEGLITAAGGSFNSPIRFYDTKSAKQSSLFGNGLRIAGGTPHLALKNTSPFDVTASPEFVPPGGRAENGTVALPPVRLAPYETREVNLDPLTAAAHGRSDLDVVSVRVTSSGDAGSLIGSLSSTSNVTGVSYDVPLRDSGPARTMTGTYPWNIGDDFTTVVYITNISDGQAEFVGQVNYEGGKYVLDPRKLAPGETVAIDLGQMRDEQKPDNAERRVPRNVKTGQFKWAVRGATGGTVRLIGRAEMASRSHKVSSSYSCNDPCPPNFDAFVTPGSEVVALSNSATLTAWETSIDSAGTVMGPFAASGTWSASDQSVCTLNSPDGGHTCVATAIGTGVASILVDLGFFDFWIWDGLNCFLAGSGELFGENTFEVKHSCTIVDAGGLVLASFTFCDEVHTLEAKFKITDVPANTPPIATLSNCGATVNPDINFIDTGNNPVSTPSGSSLIVTVTIRFTIRKPGKQIPIEIICGAICEDGTSVVATHTVTVECTTFKSV